MEKKNNQSECPNQNYEQDRMDHMGTLQNKIIEAIGIARIPTQDVLMVLRVTQRQVEDVFMMRLAALSAQVDTEKEKPDGS